MTNVWYATREDVKSALDVAQSVRSNSRIDRALEAASRKVEAELHRRFYPYKGTKYFNWPSYPDLTPGWKLWLNDNELVSATTITAGGVAVTDYYLEPINSGPPYSAVEVNRGTSSVFTAGDTPQRNIAITGVFGYKLDESTYGLTAEALDSSETSVDVDGPTSAAVGVGSLVRVDDERMIVTNRSFATTGTTISGNLTASGGPNTSTVPVSDGSGFAAGETILVDSEKMFIEEVVANNLLVRRAYDGSTLAAHSSGATVYAPRQLVVTRAALGTTAAAHNDDSSLYVFNFPGPVKAYCIALVIDQLLQESSGYARTIGSGDNQQESAGRGLQRAKDAAYTSCGRKARMRSV